MKILYCYIGEDSKVHKEIRDVEDKLEVYQELVDGPIEVYPLTKNIIIVLNEEGKLRFKPIIAIALSELTDMPELIAGNFFICRRENFDFADLNIEEDLNEINSRILVAQK